MRDELHAEMVSIRGHEGDEVQAYLARPLGPGPFGGVVVIHHMPGFDEWSKEVTRTFAAHGYQAICPNLYWREAPGAPPDDAAAIARSRGGVPDERLVGDVRGAIEHLGSWTASNGKVASIGYCSGGRQSFLAACSLRLDAAVDCYGAFVVGEPPQGLGLSVRPLVDLVPKLSCPLLGLFGAEDQHPSVEQNAELEQALEEAGKEFEFHTYEGAGHAFFCPSRPSYRVEAANAGWGEIWSFFARHLGPAA